MGIVSVVVVYLRGGIVELIGAITSMIEAAQTATLNGKTASNEAVSWDSLD